MGKKNGICIYNGILFSRKKRNSASCYMKWPWKHYDKSDREKQVLYDITHVESKKVRIAETEQNDDCSGLGCGRNEILVKMYRLPLISSEENV